MTTAVAADRVASIYRDTMRLAEAARGYFDRDGVEARTAMTPELRAAIATESVRVTARLLAVVSWVLTQQEMAAGNAIGRSNILDNVIDEPPLSGKLPEPARRIAESTRALYADVRSLAQGV